MTTGEKSLEGVKPVAKHMLTFVPRNLRTGCPLGRFSHSMIAHSRELLSLVSDNLLSCVTGFSFHFFFSLCNVEQTPLVET